ncbi:MAG: N-acetyltransferase [Gemmatales bacterium]|nr:GNAT family N-acetyltransferase [Gemmatales bacterium]MDW7994793.1 N-acetyltransferase [Gemmatales bacterium]
MVHWRLTLRNLERDDCQCVAELARNTGVFRPVELAVLAEVIEEYLRAPGGEGYYATVAELKLTADQADSSEYQEVFEDAQKSLEPVRELTTHQVSWFRPGVAGFVIFGPTPLTVHTWDIYWIAVSRDVQRHGIGSRLLESAEARIRAQRGKLVRVETSSLPTYEATRRFYEKHGYQRAGVIPDFYADGDDLVIYYKRLPRLSR